MKLYSRLLLMVALITASLQAFGQQPSAAETLDKLKLQLAEVQSKEESLRSRLEQLDEQLKPENIERALAGVGSTKPEELREHRRRQLTIERDGILAQLQTLETSRTRLEAAIASAEGRAYQESASPAPEVTSQMFAASPGMFSGRALAIAVPSIVFLAGVGLFVLRRKIKS